MEMFKNIEPGGCRQMAGFDEIDRQGILQGLDKKLWVLTTNITGRYSNISKEKEYPASSP